MRQVASSCILLLAVASSLVSAATQSKARILPYAANQSIVRRLLPGDDTVVVQRDVEPIVSERRPSAREFVSQLLVGDQPLSVIVADITRVEGQLVDDDRWIHSRFEGRVVRALRQPRSAARPILRKGDAVTFSVDGGAVRIGTVLVKTDNAVAFPTDRRYLLFIGAPDELTGKPLAKTLPVLVEGEKLRVGGEANSLLTALSLTEVSKIVRSVR